MAKKRKETIKKELLEMLSMMVIEEESDDPIVRMLQKQNYGGSTELEIKARHLYVVLEKHQRAKNKVELERLKSEIKLFEEDHPGVRDALIEEFKKFEKYQKEQIESNEKAMSVNLRVEKHRRKKAAEKFSNSYFNGESEVNLDSFVEAKSRDLCKKYAFVEYVVFKEDFITDLRNELKNEEPDTETYSIIQLLDSWSKVDSYLNLQKILGNK